MMVKLSRRKLLGAASALALLASLPAEASGHGIPVVVPPWNRVLLGGGGYLTGMDIAPDGTRVVRTDTYGAYLWNNTTGMWSQLVNSLSMPTAAVNLNVNGLPGVYEIRIAPSNTNIFYMVWLGYVYVSTNRGTTWTQTALARQIDTSPQDAYRTVQKKMAVDSANPNIVYIGTRSGGVNVTTDGGNTWAAVAPNIFGTAVSAGYSIAFDPSSAVVGGVTQGIYIAKENVGVYHSTDGGNTWTLTRGTPTAFSNIFVGQDGVLYLVYGGANFCYNYTGGVWTANPIGAAGARVTVDPANAARVVVMAGAGGITVSLDHGATFTPFIGGIRSSPKIPWLAWTNESYMSPGNIMFDPLQSNVLIFAAGIGVWYTSPPNSYVSTVNWTTITEGIENMEANRVVSPNFHASVPVVIQWDRPFFRINDPTAYPSVGGPNNANPIVHGWDIDWAGGGPLFIAGIFNSASPLDISGYSSDGGVIWTTFPTFPTRHIYGGMMAVASPTNIVWIPTNTTGYYTNDTGTTWTACTVPSRANFTTNPNNKRHTLCADKQKIGTFYVYDQNNGTLISTDGGATFTVACSTIFPHSVFGGDSTLNCDPLVGGKLYFCQGPSGFETLTSPDTTRLLYRSLDGGTTWAGIGNVCNVRFFGFGKGLPGSSYCTFWMAGYVMVGRVWIFGIWYSNDNLVTWNAAALPETNGSGWPNNSLDYIEGISGDMNIHGRVYVAFQGSSYAWRDLGANA